MKKWITGFLAVLIAISLAGCDSWFSGSYSSVKPHEESYDDRSLDALEASSNSQIQEILSRQVANATENCVIYISEMDTENLSSVMEMMIRRIQTQDPIGAFAVEKIQYEIGTSTGRTAVAVNITYNRSRAEILRIEKTEHMEQVFAAIENALDACNAGVVVLTEDYRETDFVQLVQDYMDLHPDTCMEMPQVSASVYPESGKRRVVELSFGYQTSRDALRSMQTYVEPVFRAASLNVSGEEEESVKFSLMYAFLMERNDYELETSITPAYSLLRHGVGDSKAFATVYAAMCNKAGLSCQVISGTHNGSPWYWNLICQDGVYYHIDLVRSNTYGELQRLSDEDMDGYVWDYSAHPAAVAPQPENTEITTEETVPESATPLETEPTEAEETVPESTESVTEPPAE